MKHINLSIKGLDNIKADRPLKDFSYIKEYLTNGVTVATIASGSNDQLLSQYAAKHINIELSKYISTNFNNFITNKNEAVSAFKKEIHNVLEVVRNEIIKEYDESKSKQVAQMMNLLDQKVDQANDPSEVRELHSLIQKKEKEISKKIDSLINKIKKSPLTVFDCELILLAIKGDKFVSMMVGNGIVIASRENKLDIISKYKGEPIYVTSNDLDSNISVTIGNSKDISSFILANRGLQNFIYDDITGFNARLPMMVNRFNSDEHQDIQKTEVERVLSSVFIDESSFDMSLCMVQNPAHIIETVNREINLVSEDSLDVVEKLNMNIEPSREDELTNKKIDAVVESYHNKLKHVLPDNAPINLSQEVVDQRMEATKKMQKIADSVKPTQGSEYDLNILSRKDIVEDVKSDFLTFSEQKNNNPKFTFENLEYSTVKKEQFVQQDTKEFEVDKKVSEIAKAVEEEKVELKAINIVSDDTVNTLDKFDQTVVKNNTSSRLDSTDQIVDFVQETSIPNTNKEVGIPPKKNVNNYNMESIIVESDNQSNNQPLSVTLETDSTNNQTPFSIRTDSLGEVNLDNSNQVQPKVVVPEQPKVIEPEQPKVVDTQQSIDNLNIDLSSLNTDSLEQVNSESSNIEEVTSEETNISNKEQNDIVKDNEKDSPRETINPETTNLQEITESSKPSSDTPIVNNIVEGDDPIQQNELKQNTLELNDGQRIVSKEIEEVVTPEDLLHTKEIIEVYDEDNDKYDLKHSPVVNSIVKPAKQISENEEFALNDLVDLSSLGKIADEDNQEIESNDNDDSFNKFIPEMPMEEIIKNKVVDLSSIGEMFGNTSSKELKENLENINIDDLVKDPYKKQ